MTKQRTQHSHPEGEPLNTQTWNTPKPQRPGQGQVESEQRDRSTRPDVRRSSASPTRRSEEPVSHPRKGGHWIGNPELKAPREKRKRPGETGVPGLQNKNLKDGEPAEKGRDGHIAPSVRETPCVREGTSPEATPVPPCQPQKPRPFSREKRGVEPEAPCRETSCSKQKGKLPGEQPVSQPSEENPARHRAGERQHQPGRRSRPNPRRGRTATGREEEGPRPTSPSVRVPQTQDPPEARTVKCGTYIATEQNGLPKEGTKPPRGKATPRQSRTARKSPTVAIPSIEIRSKIQTR